MTNEIQIYNIKTVLTKELLANEVAITRFIADIDKLKTLTFDFSTEEGVKQAKELKTQANKTVKVLKEFCEPLEAEGKRIADARSKISTKLTTGKDNVIDAILKPINDAEAKLKEIKAKLLIPINDLHSAQIRLAEYEELASFNWLILKDEALQTIEQLMDLAVVAKIKFEKEAKEKAEAEEKARLEREEQIRQQAEQKAREAAQREIDEANKRAAQAEQEAKRKLEFEAKQKADAEAKAKIDEELKTKNKEHQAKIHNEIVDDYINFIDHNEGLAKDLVRAIAKGEIRNLSIKY